VVPIVPPAHDKNKGEFVAVQFSQLKELTPIVSMTGFDGFARFDR
jgi:hypothetical protein